MCSHSSLRHALPTNLALLQLERIFEGPARGESFSRRIIKLIHNRAWRGWTRVGRGGIGAFLFFCERQQRVAQALGLDSPSITLPSLQFPGLLCFGAGAFNLILPAGLSFEAFLGATLMVESSSLATEAG
jgi:hypothetical protein